MPDTRRNWPGFLRAMDQLEQHYKSAGREDLPPNAVPFLPYWTEDWIAMLAAAVKACAPAAGPGGPIRYLEVGCGPGAKLRIAEALFGLQVAGIDIQRDLVKQANHGRHRTVAHVGDAATYRDYARHDIVYYNRPVDGTAMIAAEQHVMASMRRGAVLIHVFGHADPGQSGWLPVYVKTLAPVTGVWVKPP